MSNKQSTIRMGALMTRRWQRVFLLGFCLMLPWVAGCSVNPATGRSQLNFVSEQQEIAIGTKASPSFVSQYGNEIPSKRIVQYVVSIGKRLASVSERPNLPWTFHVLNSEVINAFALPGGKVFISRGLLAKLTNEAQLAGVLGHEVGHVTAQHIGQQMSRNTLLQVAIAGLGVASQKSNSDWVKVLGVGTQVGGTVYLLKFGRSQESEADKLGLRYMSKLGYNPQAQLQVMDILANASKGAKQPEFLSTHPYPKTRIARIQQELQTTYPDYRTSQKYQYYQNRFRQNVLEVLKRLPPAKHRANAAKVPKR